MLKKVAIWIVRTIAGAVCGAAALQTFHLLGFFPDRILAMDVAALLKNATLASQILERAGWIFAAIGVIAVWIASGFYDEMRRRTSLADSGARPPLGGMSLSIDGSIKAIGDYSIVCAISLSNEKGSKQCVVQIDQFSGLLPQGMPFPLQLRTQQQALSKSNDPIMLLAGQTVVIPVLIASRNRTNEWFFMGTGGSTHFTPAGPTKLVLGVYSDEAPESFLIEIETDASWSPRSSVQRVDREFRLRFGPGANAPTQRGHRISLLEVLSIAETRFGWDFSGQHSLDILDFLYGLHQAGVDGDIRFYGKPNRNNFESLTRNERMVEIDRTHWREYELEIWSARNANDNFLICTLNKRVREWKQGGFADIHADRSQALAWIAADANEYRGHTKRK